MAILCNQCGESCESPHYPFPEEGSEADRAYGLINAKVRGHYCSHALTDLTEYTFSLCEPCLKKLFEGFKIPVSEAEYQVGRPLTEEERQEMRDRYNTPSHQLLTKVMHAVCDNFPAINTGEDRETPVYVSQQLWDDIQGEDWVDVHEAAPVLEGKVGEILGIPFHIAADLTGHVVRVKDQIFQVDDVQTLLS